MDPLASPGEPPVGVAMVDAAAGWLPPEAPLAMPVQDLWADPSHTVGDGRRQGSENDIWRGAMIVVAAAMTFFPVRAAYEVFSVGGITWLDSVALGLFVLLFGWLAFAFVMAATGFCLLITGGSDELELEAFDGARPAEPTAILMPIHNESVRDVVARIEAMADSLRDAGAATFDIFLLSDTRDPTMMTQEDAAFSALCGRAQAPPRVFYRRRAENTGRKAGNIADWVRRFGAAYGAMVVLDADSLMEGATLARLVATMAHNPRLGLIQTAPTVVHRATPFARLLQFAGRLYGPMLSEGLAWWSGAEGNYWGHNAIIRVRAFAEQAGLPHLPGRKPFGGEILSHDFVEAALLRRGGWEVRMAPQLPGSYEECPPTLPDMLVRERRWCQGNLQHSIVIAARGLHWTSRLHLIRGLSAYLTAPLWLAFVIVNALQPLQRKAANGAPYDLGNLRVLSWVLSLGFAALLAPKLLSLCLVFVRREERTAWGDPLKLCLGAALELLGSALVAPILMLALTRTMIGALAGRDAGWRPQRREGAELSWREAAREHGWHTASGVGLGVLAYLASPVSLIWLSPVVMGLVLAIPIARVTASPRLGEWLRTHGLLTTPEERQPPDILRRFIAKAACG